MERKLILIPILILIQTSFFPPIFKFSPNLILIFVFLFSLFKCSIFFPIFSGIFLDLFSENFFGFYFLISISIYLLISKIKKYV